MKLAHLFRTDTPWGAGGFEAAQQVAPVKAMAVGLFDPKAPRGDEFLSVHSLTQASLGSWIDGERERDSLFRSACSRGLAAGTLGETGISLKGGRRASGDASAVWVCGPPMGEHGRRWCALFVGSKDAFSGEQREALSSLVRLWQAQFDNPDELGLSLMLVGDDLRLIHADPACRLRWFIAGISGEALIREIREVSLQRWPSNGALDRPGARHDAVLAIGEQPAWVRFRTRQAAASAQTLIELRPLEADELPAVGVIEDERVAEALGYLHDHYNEGPTLSDLAAVVDVSPFHFHRVFTKHVGVSPKQYQLLKQLQVARWRLRRGREPIGEIADEVGFANHAHFTSTFRRMLGLSPSEYQRRFATCGMAPTEAEVARA